jgi:hypothetical protein
MGYLVITESEKFDILKRYGLLVEQDSFRFNRPGDKNYAPPTGPYAAPPSSEEFHDADNGALGLSIADWVALVSSFFGAPGWIISTILELQSARYYQLKGDKYEMGLRLMFMLIPFDQLIRSIPMVKKYTKKQLFDLLLSIRNKNKLKKEEISDILMLINNLKLNTKTISSYFYKFYLRIRIKSLISKMTFKEFIYFVYKKIVRDKTPRNKEKWKAITSLIFKHLAKLGLIVGSWEILFQKIADKEDKNYYETNKKLNTTLGQLGDKTIEDFVLELSTIEGVSKLISNKE